MPQATTGVQMRSAARPRTRVPISKMTSQKTRSAPAPPRNAPSACSIEAAWVTFAPRSMAILVAAPIWPLRPPTMRRRMMFAPAKSIRLTNFDDFRHGDAQPVFDQDDFAACDQAVIDIVVDGYTHQTVQLHH